MTRPDALVVGAGVSGLTTAVCLAEAGLRVAVRASVPPQQTTSAAAGAIWGPHLVEASERAAGWARQTLAVLAGLAGEPGTGVRIAEGTEACRHGPVPAPAWLAELGGYTACGPERLPAGFTHGWRYAAPLVHMPAYLGYLQARLARAGGELARGPVTTLAGAAREAGAAVVVNCAGTGARDLAGDPAVVPVRGQVAVVANPGLAEFFIGLPDEGSELIYYFPHGDTVVLGGTEVAGDGDLRPRPAVAERIIRDCAAAEPRLAGARVLGHRVGLRPVRPTVRLAAGPTAGPQVVHNYGHGGAGITLSWGCARDVTRLVTSGGT